MVMEVESGQMWATKDDPQWTLLEGTGERTYKKHINFKKSFGKPPNVVLGITFTDFINDSNHRIMVKPKNITVDGFTIEIRTWSTTHIYGAGVDWLAYDCWRIEVIVGSSENSH